VDSASTDRTVDLARRFPIRILSLPQGPHLSPALGRYFGMREAHGDFLLFLDGDCVLQQKWVGAAERALDADDGLAGIAGASYGSLPVQADGSRPQVDEYPLADYDNPPFLAGSAAYKRSVLEKVGGFHPMLASGEEEELGARIRKGGFRMRRLRVQMTQHHPPHRKETPKELLRRLRRGYFVGLGQLARMAWSLDLPIERPFADISRHVLYFFWMLLGLCTAAAAGGTGFDLAALAWAITTVLAVAAFAIRSGSLRKPAYYLLEWTLASPAVVYGLIKRPLPHDHRLPGIQPRLIARPGTAAGEHSG